MSLASRFSLLALIAVGFAATGEEAYAFPAMLTMTLPSNGVTYDLDPMTGLTLGAVGTVEPGRTVRTKLLIYAGMPTPSFQPVNTDEDDTTTNGSWATGHGTIWAEGYYRVEADDLGTGMNPDASAQFWLEYDD